MDKELDTIVKEAAEVNKKRNDMHVEKRTRDKTIRDAMVRGRGGRGARKERGMESCYLYLPFYIAFLELIIILSLYVQNVLRALRREIAEKTQEKKALEQRREECIEM